MTETESGTPLTRFLAGAGTDAAGRRIGDVLAYDDTDLERRHDYIQWLFPLPTRSAAVPSAPVMSAAERQTIRADARSLENIRRAVQRMQAFYAATDHWLTTYDHNHLRITRIITSLGLLLGAAEAAAFHDWIDARVVSANAPVNRTSRTYWRAAREEAGRPRN